MTVKKDIEKALAAAQSAQGTYSTFSSSTDDANAKQMFKQMAQDMDRHISNLQSRLSSTAENQLNSSADSAALSSATGPNQQKY